MKQPSPPRRENENLPSEGTFEFWQKASGPVLQVLEEPRDWSFLNEWIKRHRFGQSRFRQVVAWLEGRGKIVSFHRVQRDPVTHRRTTRLYWVKREWWDIHEKQMRS